MADSSGLKHPDSWLPCTWEFCGLKHCFCPCVVMHETSTKARFQTGEKLAWVVALCVVLSNVLARISLPPTFLYLSIPLIQLFVGFIMFYYAKELKKHLQVGGDSLPMLEFFCSFLGCGICVLETMRQTTDHVLVGRPILPKAFHPCHVAPQGQNCYYPQPQPQVVQGMLIQQQQQPQQQQQQAFVQPGMMPLVQQAFVQQQQQQQPQAFVQPGMMPLVQQAFVQQQQQQPQAFVQPGMMPLVQQAFVQQQQQPQQQFAQQVWQGAPQQHSQQRF